MISSTVLLANDIENVLINDGFVPAVFERNNYLL